jgi:hypothetical protein
MEGPGDLSGGGEATPACDVDCFDGSFFNLFLLQNLFRLAVSAVIGL